MANILILGAGSMGTAFSFPCSDNNHVVSIIGTHLENDFIDLINSKKTHPILNCDIPKNVNFFKFEKLGEEISKKVNKQMINVFVPTTPNPTSGFLLMYPKDEVIYLDMYVIILVIQLLHILLKKVLK